MRSSEVYSVPEQVILEGRPLWARQVDLLSVFIEQVMQLVIRPVFQVADLVLCGIQTDGES